MVGQDGTARSHRNHLHYVVHPVGSCSGYTRLTKVWDRLLSNRTFVDLVWDMYGICVMCEHT